MKSRESTNLLNEDATNWIFDSNGINDRYPVLILLVDKNRSPSNYLRGLWENPPPYSGIACFNGRHLQVKPNFPFYKDSLSILIYFDFFWEIIYIFAFAILHAEHGQGYTYSTILRIRTGFNSRVILKQQNTFNQFFN